MGSRFGAPKARPGPSRARSRRSPTPLSRRLGPPRRNPVYLDWFLQGPMRRAFPLLLAAFLAVLAMPAGASAALFGSDASFGSGAQPDGKFVQIGGIATDNAG